MADWLIFIIASLATFYAASSISDEKIDGPWGAFRALRSLWTDPKDWKARGIRCIVCVSFWVALPIAVALIVVGGWDAWLFPLWWLGLAGASVMLDRYWKR